MKNETVTLSRAAFEREVQCKAERFQPDFRRYGDDPEAEYKDATLQWAYELWQKSAALAEPVPPAGGDLHCWKCKADFTLEDRQKCDGCCWKCGADLELDGYVTRLQA